MQYQLQLFVGSLNSKRDFEVAFQIKGTDSDDDKAVKKVFGGIAIKFVKYEAFNIFKNLKYEQEVITQRHAVVTWIEKLSNA